MAFVNETVLGDAAKNRTIDYERDAILRGGGSIYNSDVHQFMLTWKGHKIKFTAVMKKLSWDNATFSGEINYMIHSCEYAEELRPFRNEIRQMIVESLEAYGGGYKKKDTLKVSVQVPPAIGNLNPNFDWETKTFKDAPIELPRALN